MKQLMMVRRQAPVPQIKMPEGWTIRSMMPGEGARWSEICGGEFWPVGEMSGEERWQKVMGGDPGVLAENVFFACDPEGTPQATATARLLDASQLSQFPPSTAGLGYLHYVAAMPLCRGKGVGSAVTAKVAERLTGLGLPDCVLTTDDPRLAAIKSYFRLGWVPVLYDTDMRPRWQTILKSLGMQSTEAMGMDGSAAEPIQAEQG